MFLKTKRCFPECDMVIKENCVGQAQLKDAWRSAGEKGEQSTRQRASLAAYILPKGLFLIGSWQTLSEHGKA